MLCAEPTTLLDRLRDSDGTAERTLFSRTAAVALRDLDGRSGLGDGLGLLQGRSVLLATGDQLTTALALIELDGLARRIVLLPPDADLVHLPAIVARAQIDAAVTSAGAPHDLGTPVQLGYRPELRPVDRAALLRTRTEWVLFTSGTSGVPKMVVHTLARLTGAIKRSRADDRPPVWATFYDIRRYGGLQIFLRAVLDGGSLVLSSSHEPVADHLARLGRCGVTHISGTPSQWRRVLMSPAAGAMAPRYVRLSGEIADQAVLDNLHACYPDARIGHAYASTEAGVGFEVTDGREGFPSDLIGRRGDIRMKIVEGTLRIRSSRSAEGYVGSGEPPLADDEGYVDTGDLVELRDGRYHFLGRRSGVINVGGLKVHPEEVEKVINGHPDVHMSLVRARKSPITGAVVVADVVPRGGRAADEAPDALQRAVIAHCRSQLPQHKVPVIVSVVSALPVGAAGKLARHA